MKAFFILRHQAQAMLADGRSRQLIVARLLTDPCFGEFLAEHRLTQDLTVSQKVDFANAILLAAIAQEVERGLGFLAQRPRSGKESPPAGET